nr:hypothetical protein [Abalone asfa-like virus]
MSELYQFAGIYWLVIYLINDIPIQEHVHFLVSNYTLNHIPLYYVTHNKKLYILFEEQIADSPLTDLYLQNNLASHVRIHDQEKITRCDHFNYALLFLSTRKNKVETSYELENVFMSIPRNYTLPNVVKTKFLKKYDVLPQNHEEQYTVFPPPTNG